MDRWTGFAHRLLGLDDYGAACGLDGPGGLGPGGPGTGFPPELPPIDAPVPGDLPRLP